jgi:polar amino acid transport system substrate-binding protein
MLVQPLLSAAAVSTSMTLSSHAQDAVAKAELAPTGTLRVGLVEAPSAGLIFVCRAADGGLDGVTADLGADLARQVGLPLAVTLFPNSGAAASASLAEARSCTRLARIVAAWARSRAAYSARRPARSSADMR